MAIKRVRIKDFLVFKGHFSLEFCPGVNVLIGGNGAGKTTLLKLMYATCDDKPSNKENGCRTEKFFNFVRGLKDGTHGRVIVVTDDNQKAELCPCPGEGGRRISLPTVFIPEKDMLSNSKGIPESYKYGKANYTQFEVDIIEKARVLANSPEQPLYRIICDIIKGEPQNDGQSFFMKREEIEEPVPFSLEASGYRKFGLLATLIRNEQIGSGSVLFWDEPENSLNPDLVPVLVDILLELSRDNVQIFIATHSEILASYFAVSRQKDDKVMFYSLYRDSNRIKADNGDRFDLLVPNNLTLESVKLYEKEIEKGLGGNG